jgi:hypothetical protein
MLCGFSLEMKKSLLKGLTNESIPLIVYLYPEG